MKMKNVRIQFIVLLISVVACLLLLQFGCQEQNKLKKAEAKLRINKSGPKITFDKLNHDFGQIGLMSQKKVTEFKFTNTGEGILKITEVERCCNVTTKLDKTEYAPGESGLLKIEYQSNPKPGQDIKTVHVRSNDSSKPDLTLTITASVISKISCLPKRLRLFLEEENAGCPKIVINSLDNQPFKITGFTSTGDSITAHIDSSMVATKFVLSPTVNIERLNENPKGRINISLTHPEEKMAQIAFDMLPKFSISPSPIFIINAFPQKPIIRKVSVINNYAGPFEIEAFSSPNNTIKVLGQEKISDGYQLLVEMTPPASEGKAFFRDVLVVKIKDSKELLVICQGFYSKNS